MIVQKLMPEIFIIGGQKCGTSSLFYYLSYHKDLIPSRKKEIDFFTFDSNYNKGISYYSQFFPRKYFWGSGKKAYESSVGYLYFPYALERLFNFNPNAKIIIGLRNPISRTYSAWNMYVKFSRELDNSLWYSKSNIIKSYFTNLREPAKSNGLKFLNSLYKLPFQEYIEYEISKIKTNGFLYLEPGIIEKSIYINQIMNVFSSFPRKQIYIYDLDALSSDPSKVLEEITSFLEVKEINWKNYGFEYVLKGNYAIDLSSESKNYLYNFFKPFNTGLFDTLGHRYKWEI